MTDRETLNKAKALFTGQTQGDLLAREVIAIAERLENMEAIHKAGCVVHLRAQRDELWEVLTPLKDAILFARSQRRPMGIGQDFPRTEARIHLGLGIEYGRERANLGFWIDSEQITHTDADSPSPCHRIGLALIRLAYEVAEKVKPQK